MSRPSEPSCRGVVVVADDLAENVRLIRKILESDGHLVHTAADGRAALELVATVDPDVVISDVLMPWVNGLELCRLIKSDPLTRFIPIVLITSLEDRSTRLAGIDVGADEFLSKPFDIHELRARVRALVRLKRFTDELDSAECMIMSLGRTVEARDTSTLGHCERMAELAVRFGQHLALPEHDLAALHRGGFLHDVGKIGIPDSILLKPARLTVAEREVMERHTIIGDSLLTGLRGLKQVRGIVRHHHERFDGSGYPDHLSGGAIPLIAQVVAIVDVYDALTTHRVYRTPLTSAEAEREVRLEAERGLHDPRLVTEFGRCLRRSPADVSPSLNPIPCGSRLLQPQV